MTNSTPSRPRWFRLLSIYGVSALALMVALHQLYLRNDGLSSWKGGGFGMYADYHPVYTKLLVRAKGEAPVQGPEGPHLGTLELMATAQLYPSNVNLAAVKASYIKVYGTDVLLEVWQPIFDAETATLRLGLHKRY